MPERTPTPHPTRPAETRSTRSSPLPKNWDYMANAGGPYLLASVGESDHWVLDLGGLFLGLDTARSIGGDSPADIIFPLPDLAPIEGVIERSAEEWRWRTATGELRSIDDGQSFPIGSLRAELVDRAGFFAAVTERLYRSASTISRVRTRARGPTLEHLIQEADELGRARFRDRYPGGLLIAFSVNPLGAHVSSAQGTHGLFGLDLEAIQCWPVLDTAITYELGRNRSADFVLETPAVSRRHLRFHQDANGWSIQDLKSTNGSVLDGSPLTGRRRLGAASIVHLGGRALLQFLAGEGLWSTLRGE